MRKSLSKSKHEYLTTKDIAKIRGVTPRAVSKAAKNEAPWLAPFMVCGGQNKHYRFIDCSLIRFWSMKSGDAMAYLRSLGDQKRQGNLTHREVAKMEPDYFERR